MEGAGLELHVEAHPALSLAVSLDQNFFHIHRPAARARSPVPLQRCTKSGQGEAFSLSTTRPYITLALVLAVTADILQCPQNGSDDTRALETSPPQNLSIRTLVDQLRPMLGPNRCPPRFPDVSLHHLYPSFRPPIVRAKVGSQQNSLRSRADDLCGQKHRRSWLAFDDSVFARLDRGTLAILRWLVCSAGENDFRVRHDVVPVSNFLSSCSLQGTCPLHTQPHPMQVPAYSVPLLVLFSAICC